MSSMSPSSRSGSPREGGWLDTLEQAALIVAPFSVLVGSLMAVVLFVVAVLAIWPESVSIIWASAWGETPKAFWYLSRASSFVAFGLITASMLLGLGITNKATRAWPGGPTYVALHEHTSLLGLAFGLVHALALLGDQYIGYTLGQILMPFASGEYRPFWVGLGQTALWVIAPITLSYYVRRMIGQRTWRLMHYLTFGVFGLVLVHGLLSGTDTVLAPIRMVYWLAAVVVVGLTMYRALVAVLKRADPPTPSRTR